jgi:hypothetical protein
VNAKYERKLADKHLPQVDPELITFMVNECDFDVEHADGSFLDHLYFCFEYTVQHYPKGSPLVMLLHSILGTGTNTFAMTADKMPALQALMSPHDWEQTAAFPSVLRLLYAGTMRRELWEKKGQRIKSITMRRVIDNEPIELSGEAFWEALNYQLIHLVDFLPVANWQVHQNDTSFILFRDLYQYLGEVGELRAKVDYNPASGPSKATGEPQSIGAWLTTKIPVSTSEGMAAKSVTRFSERIGHSLEYSIQWE